MSALCNWLTALMLCVSSFLCGYGHFIGFIETGFRLSYLGVMVVTDIKLVFFHSFYIRRLKKQSFLLVINSYIPTWGLQKNADGHIFQAWVTSGIGRQNTRDKARIN